VAPEAYHTLREEIARQLRTLVDPATGHKIQGRVILREEAFHGKFLDRMPDLVYMAFDDGYLAGNPVAFQSNRIIVSGLGPSGFHRMEGIFLARGRNIRKGIRLDAANLMDIAPTLLYLMGSEVPKDMDGRVLSELFEEEFLTKAPIAYREAPSEDRWQAAEISPEDQAVILDRLKGLGYVD
jgi:predicted AlkP superfamily phosphohydrolase/phosphomutase